MSISNKINLELKGDRVIWMIVAFLAICSILSVYSSTGTIAYKMKEGNTTYYLIKQILTLGAGIFLAYLCYLLHYMKYSKWAPMLLVFAIGLLLFTLLFGTDINSARRWITIPIIGITIQSSDFAKLALITYVAREIASRQEQIKDFKTAFLPILTPILIVCGLIAVANLSTALVLFTTCIIMMYIGRVQLKYIVYLLGLGIVLFAIILLMSYLTGYGRAETWISRIREFVQNTDGGYQIKQAKIAIAKGGWFGVGPGNGMQRNHLPSPYADYIYAMIMEEFGIIGALFIMILYIWLFIRSVRLVTRSPKAFGALLAVGLSIILVIQALANMAVSVDLVPVTGLALPMISMGGTSLIFSCVSFGIILSVSKFIENKHDEKNINKQTATNLQ